MGSDVGEVTAPALVESRSESGGLAAVRLDYGRRPALAGITAGGGGEPRRRSPGVDALRR